MRVYHEPAYPASRAPRIEPLPPSPTTDTRATLLLVVAESDLNQYPGHQFIRVATPTMTGALQQLSRNPSLVVMDWDLVEVNAAAELCGAAVASRASVLVVSADPACAPAAIKAGCHAILLKPFPPMLIAARLGRLAREQSIRTRFGALRGETTHRVCPEIRCPFCGAHAPTSFEFGSHRRAWFACLSCERVWLGRRLE
jgi:CheY-like chemotaxis protein